MQNQSDKQKLRIAFIHPDLGIGGAQQLVVNLALSLIKEGHEAIIYTPYHYKSFPETHDGTIKVKVHGSFFSLLPRSIFGRCLALMAYLRTILCCIRLITFDLDFDAVVCDQVSAVVPILRFFGLKTIFYCHYPDKLLAPKGGIIKKIYRFFIDLWQEVSLFYSNKIFVNSQFTRGVFEKHFKLLNKAKVKTDLLYPSIDFSKFDAECQDRIINEPYFLSLNRYERKKNINLAIEAFAKMKRTDDKFLVVAGGWDPRVNENVEHYEQLQELAKKLKVDKNVKFMRNITDVQKVSLLKHSLAVLYTPENEHFGIVPCEAMYCGVPVIACNSGGPMESIENSKTGYLIDTNDKSIDKWTQSMEAVYSDEERRKQMGVLGKERTINMFGFNTFSEKFIEGIRSVIKKKK